VTFYVPSSLNEAKSIQNSIKSRLVLKYKGNAKPKIVGGIDCAYVMLGASQKVIACIALFLFPELNEHEVVFGLEDCKFPYIPGFLSFRELGAMLNAFKSLNTVPDIMFVSGQGIAHPRMLGIASHLGVLVNIPTIGVAKKRLIGTFEMPNSEKGSTMPLGHPFKKEQIGVVMRSRALVKPIFVSPGHLMDVESAMCLTTRCIWKTKLPIPLQRAHQLAGRKCKELTVID